MLPHQLIFERGVTGFSTVEPGAYGHQVVVTRVSIDEQWLKTYVQAEIRRETQALANRMNDVEHQAAELLDKQRELIKSFFDNIMKMETFEEAKAALEADAALRGIGRNGEGTVFGV